MKGKKAEISPGMTPDNLLSETIDNFRDSQLSPFLRRALKFPLWHERVFFAENAADAFSSLARSQIKPLN